MRLKIASLPMMIALAGLGLALGGCDKQSGQQAQGNAGNAAAPAPDEVTSGEVPPSADDTAKGGGDQTFQHVSDPSHKGEAMPDKSFTGPDGKKVTLAGIAGGKPLLVNLWATWCAPCIAELPELDRLAAGAKGFSVITVSQDQGAPGHVEAFLAQHKFTALKRYLDPDNVLGFHYNTGTLPTTVLYDGQGKEVARIVGALDWTSEEGKGLLKQIGG